jgi:hypothetical protein
MCLRDGDKEWFPARVLDASVAGLRVECNHAFSRSERLLVSFPHAAKDAIETKVVWIKSGASKASEAGLEFFSPLPDVLRRLGCGRSNFSREATC